MGKKKGGSKIIFISVLVTLAILSTLILAENSIVSTQSDANANLSNNTNNDKNSESKVIGIYTLFDDNTYLPIEINQTISSMKLSGSLIGLGSAQVYLGNNLIINLSNNNEDN